MKKTYFILLTTILLTGCSNTETTGTYEPSTYESEYFEYTVTDGTMENGITEACSEETVTTETTDAEVVSNSSDKREYSPEQIILLKKKYALELATDLLVHYEYTPIVGTAFGKERYAVSIRDNDAYFYMYIPEKENFELISNTDIEEKGAQGVALLCVSESEFAFFVEDNNQIIMYLSKDGGLNWTRQVVYEDSRYYPLEVNGSALIVDGQIYLGISSYEPLNEGCVEYLRGTIEGGFELVSYHIENHNPKSFETLFRRTLGGIFLCAKWRENDGVTLSYNYVMPFFEHDAINKECVEKNEDGLFSYEKGDTRITIDTDLNIVTWNGVEGDLEESVTKNVFISEGIDIDQDGFDERILSYLVGVRSNTRSVIMDIVENEVIFTYVEIPSDLGEYTLYSSDTLEFVVGNEEPIYLDGYEDIDLIRYTYRKAEGCFDVVTGSGICFEYGPIEYSTENGDVFLYFPVWPGPSGGIAGAGLNLNIKYKYRDGILEIVGYEY